MAVYRAVAGFIALATIPVAVLAAAPALSRESAKKSVPTCPQDIPLRDISVKWPSGWEGEVSTNFALQSVTVIQGDEASHEGDIIPESEKHKGKLVETFAGLDSFPHPRWLSCNYGNFNLLRLYKRIPSNIRQCVMRYRESSPNFYTIEDYLCE